MCSICFVNLELLAFFSETYYSGSISMPTGHSLVASYNFNETAFCRHDRFHAPNCVYA